MSDTKRYKITSDGDHEYAIPEKEQGAWDEWLESDDAKLGGEPPSWAIRIDGRFTFTDPRCE